jgi:hypothetical protein
MTDEGDKVGHEHDLRSKMSGFGKSSAPRRGGICEKLASRNFAKQRETSRKVAKLREKSRNFAFFREVFFGHFAKFLSPFREVSRCFAKLFFSFREASRRFIGRFSRKLKYCFAKTRETSRTSKIFAK